MAYVLRHRGCIAQLNAGRERAFVPIILHALALGHPEPAENSDFHLVEDQRKGY